MSLRFRRSVRLFPGVRLNFSRSGISTTVGIRGATMTLGPGGAYANVGLPGTGLSYRTKVSPVPAQARRAPALAGHASDLPHAPPPTSEPRALRPGAVEITSAEVSALTSPGLGELKRLINEAADRRRELSSQAAKEKVTLARATKRLRISQAFIIRIFTQRRVPQLIEQRRLAEERLDQTTAELEGCYIEVDFGLDDAALSAYSALVRAFEQVKGCRAIWDITSVAATNRVAERTIASQAVTRTPVQFDCVAPQIVKSAQHVMRLENASGRYIHLFPAFLMMQDRTSDFALVEYGELEAECLESRFIETSGVPSDAEVVGRTWAKANKDGSPDRRFKDNYAIPIVRYAEIIFQSPTGLLEAYQFSDFGKARAFAEALAKHKLALTALTEREGVTVPADEPEDAGEEVLESQAASVPPGGPPPALLIDWLVLLCVLSALAAGGGWGYTHRADLAARIASALDPAPAAGSAPPVTAVGPPAPPHKVHRKHHHKRATTSTGAETSVSSARATAVQAVPGVR